MPIFNTQDIMPQFTSRVKEAVSIIPKVDQGFANFFGKDVLKTLGFNYWVQRQSRPVAVDVTREEEGILTSLDKSTNKKFIPFCYDYKVNYSAMDEYETIMNATDGKVDGEVFKELVKKTAMEVAANEARISRREELQRAQALLTGIIKTDKGDNIDFKRKAASLVAYNAAHDWSIDTVDPDVMMKQLIEFLITEGMVSGSGTFNMIMGGEVQSAFINNPIRQKKGDIKDQMYMSLMTGTTVNGLTPQGAYSVGNYRVNLWGYTGYYDDPDNAGATTPYMDPKKIIMLPDSVPFEMVYCGLPNWVGSTDTGFPRIVSGERIYYRLPDRKTNTIQFGVKSAFAAVLKEVDRVATAQVVPS